MASANAPILGKPPEGMPALRQLKREFTYLKVLCVAQKRIESLEGEVKTLRSENQELKDLVQEAVVLGKGIEEERGAASKIIQDQAAKIAQLQEQLRIFESFTQQLGMSLGEQNEIIQAALLESPEPK